MPYQLEFGRKLKSKLQILSQLRVKLLVCDLTPLSVLPDDVRCLLSPRIGQGPAKQSMTNPTKVADRRVSGGKQFVALYPYLHSFILPRQPSKKKPTIRGL